MIDEELYNLDFTLEKEMKEKIIVKFAAKQHGYYNVFRYYWQPFVWAAVIGFRKNLRKELSGEKEQIFNMGIMMRNGGSKCVQALICLCIAKSGSLEIMKDLKKMIAMINEYANGGFYEILSMIEHNEFGVNDFENVKMEILSRDYMEFEDDEQDEIAGEIVQTEKEEESPEVAESIKKKRNKGKWSPKQEAELKNYYKSGLTIEQLSAFFERSEEDVSEKLKNLNLL